jgi:hypothetical protein
MTATEIQAEMNYQVSERISILCEDRPPTPEQLAIAHEEARDWQRRYLAEQVQQRELL